MIALTEAEQRSKDMRRGNTIAVWVGCTVVTLVLGGMGAWAETGFDPRYQRDYNIFNPLNGLRPDNPLNPINAVDPQNPFNPINQYDPGNPANPINQYNPNNPFNPINRFHPDNPLNPIHHYNPDVPFAPLDGGKSGRSRRW